MNSSNLLAYCYNGCTKPSSLSRNALKIFLKKKSFPLTHFDLEWSMVYGNRNIRFFVNKGPQAVAEYVNWRISLTDFLFDFGGPALAYNENVGCLESSYLSEVMFESGMALTTLLAKKELGIPHLNHFLRCFGTSKTSHYRPDFVAFYGGTIYFFEAKGTFYSRNIMAEWKGLRQLNAGKSLIHSTSSIQKYVCETYTYSHQRIVCDFIDPPDDGNGFLKEDVEDNYQPLRLSFNSRISVNRKPFVGVRTSRGFFGLLDDNHRSFFSSDQQPIEEELVDEKDYFGQIFSDGTLILQSR